MAGYGEILSNNKKQSQKCFKNKQYMFTVLIETNTKEIPSFYATKQSIFLTMRSVHVKWGLMNRVSENMIDRDCRHFTIIIDI